MESATLKHPTSSLAAASFRQRWTFRILAFGIGLLLVLLTAEVGLRIAGRDAPIVFQPDPKLGWRQLPGARRQFTGEGVGLVEINRLGFRGGECSIEKPARVFRIGVFGDSMTEACGVNFNQTFCDLAERSLQSTGHRVELLNFGVVGYSTVQELLYLKEVGPRLKPDLVLLAVFLDNDVSACVAATNFGPKEVPIRVESDAGWAIDYSASEAGYRDYHRQPKYQLRRTLGLYRVMAEWKYRHLGAASPVAAKGVPLRFDFYRTQTEPPWSHAWSAFEQTLDEIAAECRQQGCELAIISVPCAQVSHPASWRDICREQFPGAGAEEWDMEAPSRRLQRWAEGHRILCLDPLMTFQSKSRDTELFFGRVGHFTPAGHELLASELAAFLSNNVAVDGAATTGSAPIESAGN